MSIKSQPTVNINYIIAVPLIVMSYHIFNFYESEPVVVRIALAISFDLMVVVCFYLLKDPYISKLPQARKATWAVLLVLILFQLAVNVWAYGELHWFRASISGSVFPVTVALVSYIGMLRQKEADRHAEQEAKRQEAAAKTQELTEHTSAESLAEERPWAGLKVEKEQIITAYQANPTEAGKDIFRGAKNWRSIGRWWEKLQEGETP